MPDNQPTPVQPDNPELTSLIPPVAAPEDVSVTTPEPQPMQPESSPALTAPIPSEQAPNNPDIERTYHEATWRHILGRIADTMTDPETWHVRRDPKTGEVTASRDPSSLGEKWGRIAATALGGLAQGIQNAQGPGGGLRATGAGIEYGLQQPKQRMEEAQKQMDAEQQRQLRSAQHVLLDQQIAAGAFDAQKRPVEWAKEMTDFRLNTLKKLDDLGGELIAHTKSPQELMAFAKAHPDVLDDHMGTSGNTLVPIPDQNGEIDWYRVSANTGNQRDPNPFTYTVARLDPKDPTKVVYSNVTEPAGNDTINNHLTKLKGIWAANDKTISQATTNSKNLGQTKDVGTYQQAYSRAAAATTPEEKQRWTELGDTLYRKALGLKQSTIVNVGVTPPGTAPAQMIAQGGAFAPETVNGENAQALASGDLLLGDLPKRMAKGAATPQEMFAAANEYSKNLYGLGFSPTMIEQEKRMFDNIKSQGVLDGIDKMIGVHGQPGYLDTVVDLGLKAGVGANAPWNEVALAVKRKLGDQAAKNFNTALGEVQRSLPSLIGNPLLGGSDSDLKLNMAKDMFGKDATAGNLVSTANTLRGMMQGSADSLTRNNRFLQRRYGLRGPYAAQFTPTTTPNATQQQDTSQAARQPSPTLKQDAVQPQRPANVPEGYVHGVGPNGSGWYKP